jgi:WD40 repeat protein
MVNKESLMRFTRTGLMARIGAALLLSLFLAASVSAQSIIWKAASAGRAVAFSPDGQALLAGTQLRRASDGSLLFTLRPPQRGNGPNAVALSPDGQFAALGIQSFNQNLDLFSVVNGALLVGPISAHNNGTTTVDFSPDRQLLASGGRDGTVKLWHLPDMKLVRTLKAVSGYRPRVFAVAFSADGRLLAVGGEDGVQLFRVSDGALIRRMSPVASTLSVAFSPDGQILAAGSNAVDQYGDCTDCTVKLWRVADGVLLRTIRGGNDGITSVVFSPNQKQITACSGDRVYSGVVRIWRVSDGALLKRFNQDPNNPSSYVTSVAYSPDGLLLAYARADLLTVVARNPFSP